jgi:hypothetical protein
MYDLEPQLYLYNQSVEEPSLTRQVIANIRFRLHLFLVECRWLAIKN